MMSKRYADAELNGTQWLTCEQSLENVLQNINKLNRSLEGVIAV